MTLRGWFERLPEDLFAVRPVLCVDYVGAMMSTGELRGVDARLQDAERWLNPSRRQHRRPGSASGEMFVSDTDQLPALPSWISIYRAAQALLGADPAGTVAYARRGLDLLAPGDDLPRGAGSALIGLASWGAGDLEAAHAGYAESMASLERAGHVADVLGCAITLADIEIVQGRLGDAMRTYERMLRLAAAPGRAGAARDRRHVRRDRRPPPRARRPGGSHAAAAAAARPSASTSGCRRTRTAGGSRWPGSARPRATWTARSSCSTRRSGLRRGLLPERAPDPGHEGAGLDRPGSAGRRPRLGTRCSGSRSTTTSATCASSSTSPWPGCSWRSTGPIAADVAQQAVRPARPAAAAARRRRQDGQRHRDPRAAVAHVSSARRRRSRPGRRWSAPSRWPSPRATSGCSSTRGHPWRRCCAGQRSRGPATGYARRLLAAFGEDARRGRPRRATWSTR